MMLMVEVFVFVCTGTFEVFCLALVQFSSASNIGRLETPFGLLRSNATLEVGTDWAIAKIGDRNLMFTFEESDRDALGEVSEKQLAILRRQLNQEDLDTKALGLLLLPQKKKASPKKKPKKASSLK